MLYTVKG